MQDGFICAGQLLRVKSSILKSWPRLIRGESACNPRFNCLDAAIGAHMLRHERVIASAGGFSVPSLLGWLAEFECLGWANAFRRRGAVARQMLRLRIRVGSKQMVRGENSREGALHFALRTSRLNDVNAQTQLSSGSGLNATFLRNGCKRSRLDSTRATTVMGLIRIVSIPDSLTIGR